MLRSYQVKTYIAVFVIAALQASLGGPNVLADDKGMDFQVKVNEGLSVDISTPSNWAMGDSGTFITNKINVSVTSNNAAGYHVSMTSKDATPTLVNVRNAAATIPTLSADWTRASSVNNFWGYSVDDETYKPVVGLGGTPTRLLDSDHSGSGSQDVYFGAKIDTSHEAGTYTGKVLISVVTGTISGDNPVTPSNPAQPVDENDKPYYDESGAGYPSESTGVTTYTTRTNSSVTNRPENDTSNSAPDNTTHTTINDGDVRSMYEPPQGEVVTTGNSFLPTVLVATSVVAANSGIVFFTLAKRRDDEEDSEEA